MTLEELLRKAPVGIQYIRQLGKITRVEASIEATERRLKDLLVKSW